MPKDKIKETIKGTTLEDPARRAKNAAKHVRQSAGIPQYYISNRHYKDQRKIIYAITPPARLDNIGDHAQVLGIKKWLNSYFSSYEILEVDKDQTNRFMPAIKRLTNDDDLIFLHSGGNLNHRSLWSEGARRKIIKNFPENNIIQLPQTIYFDDEPAARKELETSRLIYNSHKHLSIAARDPVSLDYAKKYFDVETLIAPDFALMINSDQYIDSDITRSGGMLCLRRDEESNVDKEQKETLRSYLTDENIEATKFDTTLDHPIEKSQREKHLQNTLQRFATNEIVITDRFHGMIFSVITNTPCIAIDTVDHKISSSSNWFEELDTVEYVKDIKYIPELIEQIKNEISSGIDMEERYFKEFASNVKDSISSDLIEK